ncbi:MAG: ribose-phosphate diphosphokinase, partial [Pseudomonadota bacterium]|nr:ribose-phosphate diphosphokinase [Pseudomonadota bacterium]
MKIIAGYSSVNLTHAVCKMLDTKPVLPTYKRFSDGEISVDIAQKDIQDDACLLIHSLSEPVNETIIALLLTINALKQSGAKKIVVCLPYLAYTRQTAASLITSLIDAAGAHKCITIDPHTTIRNAIIPIDALSTAQLFADHIKATHNLQNLVIVAPDQGGVERCKHVRDALELTSSLACIDKIRVDGLCTVQAVHGDVLGKRCVIVDDIIDTGTTLCNAAEALIQNGALEVFAYCTHGVLSGGALDRVKQSPIMNLVITNTI